jgi:hypothetical protein
MLHFPVVTAIGAVLAATDGERNSGPIPGGRTPTWTLTSRLEWRRRNVFARKVLYQLWVGEETGESSWRPIPQG